MAEKLITKSFERLLDKGKHRGFVTYEELGKSLGKRSGTHENLERAFIILVDEKITLVEKKSQFQSNKKKETPASSEEKSSDKSDDPIRMYLREMGGVELLSREGEIAIAKRIEAGKDVMINALTQSPLVGKKIKEWKDQIETQQLLVRKGFEKRRWRHAAYRAGSEEAWRGILDCNFGLDDPVHPGRRSVKRG